MFMHILIFFLFISTILSLQVKDKKQLKLKTHGVSFLRTVPKDLKSISPVRKLKVHPFNLSKSDFEIYKEKQNKLKLVSESPKTAEIVEIEPKFSLVMNHDVPHVFLDLSNEDLSPEDSTTITNYGHQIDWKECLRIIDEESHSVKDLQESKDTLLRSSIASKDLSLPSSLPGDLQVNSSSLLHAHEDFKQNDASVNNPIYTVRKNKFGRFFCFMK